MKNFFKSLVVGALLLGSVGCSDMFKEEIYDIYNELDNINARIDSLCNAVNTNIASLQTIIDVMQDNDYVDSITPIVENGVTIGYEIVFTQSGSVKIYHGEKGETGATGHSPVVGVKQAEDGRWYWTIDGEWMVNAEGKKILAEAIDGEDGAPGADGIPGIDGITPKLKVQDNYWYISYDNGTTWERLGKATGEAGADGDSMFQSVNYNEDYVELVLVDGTVLTIPTWASHMLLVDEIAKINNNISALQAAVKALESNDYVQKVTPVKDEEGNVVGYTLQFAFAGDVTIYHGEDGEKGEDGHTPVIGVKQFNGEWYWTIDGEWLVDGNGEMVPTSGEDGAEGAEGQAGITPELKTEDDYWYVSYDKGQTWTKLGKAKGEDGAAGGDGAAGDAFFEDVDTSDEYYIILTLADGTEIKIPTWKAHQALADAVAQLNTNVTSLQAIITGIQNNDFVTGTTEIVDPQTNEVIGYKLHFSKSGDIEIYHGKTPNAPEIGIRKHPQYGLCWTYNGEYIKDPGTGKPVALPKDGANAIAPKFKIENGMWYMSTDDGRTWQEVGQATGDQGETGATGGSGDSFFKSIVPEYAKDDKGNVLKDELGRPIVAYIVMTLAGENEGEDVVYKVPTEYVTSELTKRIAAIEAQFTTISTIVNALQKAEYIKEVVELTEGLNVVGYEITFVKYTLNPDGTLSETIRKSTIRNGAGGAAGTVVDAEYDEKTGIWYWTLDGKPLIDEETGEVVPINGQAGVTPQMRINPETNFWEISYDNGNTWESTDVKATGPQGTPGQGGAAGDSFFVDVYKSSDGKFWIFERTEGEAIKVPTAEAFAALQNEVGLIKSNLNVIASAINGSKYITDFKERKDANGNVVGFDANLITYVLSYDETSGAYTFSTTDTEKIQYTANDVVTLIKKEDGYYWHIATGTSEDGTTSYIDVKVDGADWVPSVVLHADGNIYISKVSGHDESTLAADLAATGWEQYWIKIDTSKTTDTNTYSTVENILGKDGKTVVGYRITFAEGQVIEVPTKAGFDALVNDVNGLKSNVLALNDFVNGNSYITDYEPIVENGKTVGFNANLVQYTITEGEDGNWVVSDPTKSHITFRYDCTVTVVNKGTEDVPVWEWVVDGEETGIPMEGWVPEVVLHTDNNIYISKVSGHDESTLAADIERGDWAKYWIQIDTSKTQDTNTFATVTGDDKTGYEITFADGTKITVPSMDQFATLVLEVRDLQNNIKALNNFVNSNSYITDYEDIVENGKTVGFKAKQVEYTLVKGEDGNYTTSVSKTTPIEFYYACMVTVVNKGTEDAPVWEWVVDGEETGIPMDGSDWVPSVVLHTDNNIYISKANGHDANTLAKDLTEDGWEQYWIKIDTSKTTDTFATVTGNENDGYTIEFPTGDKIKVPSYKQFQDVLDRLDEVEGAVEDIQGTISTINGSLESLSEQITALQEVQGNYLTSEAFQAWKDGARFVQNVTKDGDVWSFVVADGNGKAIEDAGFDITATPDVSTYEKDGVLYWVINGKETEYPVESKPHFKVDGSGRLMFTFDDPKSETAKWTVLESASNNVVDVVFTNDPAVGPDEKLNPTDANWVGIYYSEKNIIWMPTYKNFKDIEERLVDVEDAVETIQNDIVDLTTSLTELETELAQVKTNQAEYLTSAEFEEWKSKTQFVKSVVRDGEKLTFEVVKGNGDPVETVEYDVNHPVSTYKNKDGELYWVINGKETEYPVESKPKFQVDQLSGNLQFSFDGKEWTTLESASNNVVDVVFTNDPYPTEGEWVKVAAADALWVGIYYGENNIIWMPTYKNFNELVATVTRISEKVAALGRFVTGRNFVKDFKEVKDDEGNVVGFKATLVDYKYDETSKEYVLNTDTEELTFTYENPVSVIEEDGKYYWHIKTADGYVDILADGSSYPKVELYNGKIYVSVDSRSTTAQADIEGGNEAYWKLMDITQTVDTDTHATCTEETIDGYLYYVIKMWTEDGTTTEIKVPSAAAFSALVEKVTTLENTVAGLQTLLSNLDFTFVTGITEKKDASGNVIGIDFTTKTVTDGTVADGTPGSVSFDGLVTPNADGDGFTISGYEGELSWKHDLKFVIENGVIKFSIDGGKTWAEVTLPVDKNTNNFGRTEEILETIGSTNIVTGYKIYFPDPKDPTKEVGPYEVRKWFTTPVITFGTDGTLALGNNSSATVTCTITGSFTEAPKIYTTCEGHFTSTASAVSGSGNTYTTTITVKPTTAYDTTLEGKLTVYCPYYGNTGIGQLNLTATGAGIGINSVTKSGNDTQATITIDGIVEQSGEELILKAVDGDPSWISMGNVSNPSNTKLQQTLTFNPYVIGSKQDLENGQVRQERTCTLAVVTPSGREAGYVAVNQAPIINLADQGSANCYIISAPGRYMIPARKGNSTNALWSTRPSNVSVTKTTDDGKNTVNFTSDQILFEYQGKDYIIFDIPNSIQNGNTVIALKSGNEVLWSWHLWFNTASNRADADDKLDKYVDNNGYFNGRYVMNRALGATEMTGLALSQLNNYIDLGLGDYAYYWEDGFYYQWGRKDPLQAQTASTGGTYEVAKQNPSKFYSDWTPADNAWSSTKTVDDPCPPGYKVPSSTVWRSSNPDQDQFTTTSTTYTYNLSQDTGDSYPTNYIIYPYSSHLDSQGQKVSYPVTNLTQNGSTTLYSSSRSLGTYFGRTYYVRLKYSGTTSTVSSWMHGVDKSLFFSVQTFDIGSSYTMQYSTNNQTFSDIPGSGTIVSILNRLGLGDRIGEILAELKEAKREYSNNIEHTLENCVYATHIRCVKE